jgi:replication factor A1
MSFSVSDHTGQLWLSAFNEIGQVILGRTADEMERLRGEDEAAFQQIIYAAQCKVYEFVGRAKSDSFNDVMRVRYQAQTAK